MNKPFQTFDEHGDATQCAPRLAALRAELAQRGCQGFLVPRADEHQGEYVPKRAERLAWLTAFTGSAGVAAEQDPFVVIAGSLYLIGEAMELLGLGPVLAADEKALNNWQPTNPPVKTL